MAATLTDWVRDFDEAQAPADILADGRTRLLDVIGLCLAAAPTPLGRSIHAGIADLYGSGCGSNVIGYGTDCPAHLAAMVNGTLAHAMDFDDTHLPSLMHPSAPIAAAALALAERHRRTGHEVLMALIAGNEAACRLAMAVPGGFHAKGLHPTGILSAPVVAMVAARLMGLDRDKSINAVGIACSQASGLLESYKDGTWVKTLHPGWSAHAGIVAAHLAKAGFTGPSSGLDGRFGLLRAMLDGPATVLDEAAVTGDLGTIWQSRTNFYKLYPCAQVILPFIELALQMRPSLPDPASLTRISIEIPAYCIPVVCEPRQEKIAPRTNTQARASVAYAVAVALARGRVGVDAYSDSAIFETDVLDIARLVEHAPFDTVPDGEGFAGAITVEWQGGSSGRRVRVSRSGHPEEADTRRAVTQKFLDLAGPLLGPDRAESLVDAVNAIEKHSEIRGLIAQTGLQDLDG
jgi:2-methylcitrate dehydratase PrpD